MYTQQEVSRHLKNFIKSSLNDTFKIVTSDNHVIDYHLRCNYLIEGNNLVGHENAPIMNISNISEFIESLTLLINKMSEYYHNDKEYFDFTDSNFLDYLLVCCFSNMSELDLNNPIAYFKTMVNVYYNDFSFVTKNIGNITIKGKNISIYETTSKNKASMEAPANKQFFFQCDNDFFYLPKIHYYIVNDCCYLMAIQNKKEKQQNKLAKELDRYLRKLDKGLDDIEKSTDGKIENVKDISPSSLAALTLFMSSQNDIRTFKFPSFLPFRYANKAGVLKCKNIDENEADRIQNNITNKFLFTAIRICEHFDKSSFDYIDGNYLELQFNPATSKTDNIIYDLYHSITANKKNK